MKETCKFCGKRLGARRIKDGVDWCEMCVRRPAKTRKPNLDAPCPNKTTGLRSTRIEE